MFLTGHFILEILPAKDLGWNARTELQTLSAS